MAYSAGGGAFGRRRSASSMRPGRRANARRKMATRLGATKVARPRASARARTRANANARFKRSY